MAKKGIVTKADITNLFFRHTWGLQLGMNYETMQAPGYCYSMLPILKKLYADDPASLKQAVKLHLNFFNTEGRLAGLIFGADVALEEEFGMSNPDAIIGLKTGLMGPFAGIGDTVFVTLFKAIFYTLAAQMAMAGSYAMVFMPFFASLARNWVRYYFTHLGYAQGRKVASTLVSSIRTITEGANILGLTVVGAMAPSVVKATLAVEFVLGEVDGEPVVQTLQAMLDSLFPSLLPVAVVFLSYWLLRKKWMNPTKLMLVLLALGILLYNLKILA